MTTDQPIENSTAPQSRQPADSVPQQPVSRSLLAGINPGVVATLAIGLGLAVVTLFLVWLFARPIAILVSGIIIAQALSAIVDFLARWMKRSIAIAATYISILAILILMGWIIVPALVQQGQDLVERAPDLYAQGQEWLDNSPLGDRFTSKDLEEQITGYIGQFGGQLASLPIAIVSTLFDVVMIVIISVYWIVAGPSLRRFALSLFPPQTQGKVGSVMGEMGQTMGGYVRGVVLNSSILTVIAYIGFTIIGLEYALVLALIAGLLDIVPIVGPVVATVPIVGIALLDSFTIAVITLAFWIAVQQFESYVTLPVVMHSQAEIPPLIVLLAVFWGGTVGGILGALLAIPVAGALRVFFIRVMAPAIRRWTGAIDGDLEGPPLPPLSPTGH